MATSDGGGLTECPYGGRRWETVGGSQDTRVCRKTRRFWGRGVSLRDNTS